MHLSWGEMAQADDRFSGELPALTLVCHEGPLLQSLGAPSLAPSSSSRSRNPVSDSQWKLERTRSCITAPLVAIVSLIIEPQVFGKVSGDFTPAG